MKSKVLAVLKPKAKNLGFTAEELDGVAATLAGNLTDESTEEQINQQVDAAIPLLQVSQTAVNRIVNARIETPPAPKESKPEPEQGANNQDEKLDKLLELVEKQNERIGQLENKNVGEQRRSLLEQKLDGLLPAHKKDILDDFNLLKFGSDEEFNTWLANKEARIAGIRQELADEGLSNMKPPQGGGSTKSEEDSFAQLMSSINQTENK